MLLEPVVGFEPTTVRLQIGCFLSQPVLPSCVKSLKALQILSFPVTACDVAQPRPTQKVAQQVAQQNHPSGARKWEARVFRRSWVHDGRRHEASTYSVRLRHSGRREIINLRTGDLREAARRASKLATSLKANGWEAALATLGPEPVRQLLTRATPTIGEFITEMEKVAVHIKRQTLRGYAASIRQLASLVAGIEGDATRYNYRPGGGLEKWRADVDRVPLTVLTPRAIEAAIAEYVRKRGGTLAAQRSACSLMRQARGYWSRKMLRFHPSEGVPNPFDGVPVAQPRPPRYIPSFDSGKLVAAARTELREPDPEAWKAFLLLLGAGLRKGEADALLWSDVDVDRSVLRVISGKTLESIGEVPLGPEATSELSRLHRRSAGPYVLEGAEHRSDSTRRCYRAVATFNRLIDWLRSHGVRDSKPLHALRKEAGSLINAAAGIHAASRFLRHADIAVTAAHYLDNRNRVIVPLFDKT